MIRIFRLYQIKGQFAYEIEIDSGTSATSGLWLGQAHFEMCELCYLLSPQQYIYSPPNYQDGISKGVSILIWW